MGIICFWHACPQHLNYYIITSSVKERTLHERVRMFHCIAMFLAWFEEKWEKCRFFTFSAVTSFAQSKWPMLL